MLWVFYCVRCVMLCTDEKCDEWVRKVKAVSCVLWSLVPASDASSLDRTR